MTRSKWICYLPDVDVSRREWTCSRGERTCSPAPETDLLSDVHMHMQESTIASGNHIHTHTTKLLIILIIPDIDDALALIVRILKY